MKVPPVHRTMPPGDRRAEPTWPKKQPKTFDNALEQAIKNIHENITIPGREKP